MERICCCPGEEGDKGRPLTSSPSPSCSTPSLGFAMIRPIKKSRRLIVALSLIFFSFFIVFPPGKILSPDDTEMEYQHTARILKAIGPQISDVVEPNSHKLLYGPEHFCQGSSPYILFMFITSPYNYERRQVLRDILEEQVPQWSDIVVQQNPKYNGGSPIKFLFFTGRPTGGSLASTNALIKEGQEHKDMVVDDFLESYLNLTVKTLRMLKWVENNCANAQYLVKIDDDVHLNVPLLLDFLQPYDSSETGQDLIAGHKYENLNADDNPYSKWYTPKILWDKKLPDFAGGFFYVLGRNVRKNLYEAALQKKLFHLEDVFLTGIVREEALHVPVVDIDEVRVDNRHWILRLPCSFMRTMVALHPVTPTNLKCYSQVPKLCETHPFTPMAMLC